MNTFYQEMVTQKSWQILTGLKKQLEFVLIGGWAVYLHCQALKSKDIDMIVDYLSLDKLRKQYQMAKNDRLKKYEIILDGINIDLYLPHYSNLGLPVEKLAHLTEKKEGFILLRKEALLITKQTAYFSRRASIKGEKDKIDIIALLLLPDFDFNYYHDLINQYRLIHYPPLLSKIFQETLVVPELDLNRHLFAKKKKEIIKKLSASI